MADGIEYFSEYDYKLAYRNGRKPTHVQYYKGLGTFTDAQAKQIGRNFHKYIKQICYNKERDKTLINSFFGKDAECRKNAILNYRPHKG